MVALACARAVQPAGPIGEISAFGSGGQAAAPVPANPSTLPEPQQDLAARFGNRPPLETIRGRATYYSDALTGNPTASGEPYDPRAFTAAHRTLPFGTVVRVRSIADGRTVYVRINDRGPFGDRRRVIDLSRAAAESLDILREGVAEVVVEVLERSER